MHVQDEDLTTYAAGRRFGKAAGLEPRLHLVHSRRRQQCRGHRHCVQGLSSVRATRLKWVLNEKNAFRTVQRAPYMATL